MSSLVHAYASDDDDGVDNDIFGIANIPAANKIRSISPRPTSIDPAPHVLHQVRSIASTSHLAHLPP